jgi:hypothetical protein
MIPLMAYIRISSRRGRHSFGFPLLLLWLVLFPLLLLALPLILLVCLALRMNPLELISSIWLLIAGLKGTDIEIATGPRLFAIRIP